MHSLNTFSMLFTLLISTNAALDGVRIADQARFIQSQLPLPLGTQLPESKDLGIPTSTKISFEATPPVTNPRQCPQTCAARAAAAIGCGSLWVYRSNNVGVSNEVLTGVICNACAVGAQGSRASRCGVLVPLIAISGRVNKFCAIYK